MKYTTLLLFFSTFISFSQEEGSLICNVQFDYKSGCATNNLVLTSSTNQIVFERFRTNDTLEHIPADTYRAHFYSCDSSYSYEQTIEIVANEIRHFNFYNNANLIEQSWNLSDSNYYYYPPIFVNHSMHFGRGINYDNTSPNIQSNYVFEYSVGQDFLLNESPFALGYDIGLGINQSNYGSVDFIDTSIIHEHQRFTSVNLSPAVLASIYVANKKLLDIGIKYNIPIYARVASINGNEKLTTKGVHNYKDFRLFAHLGYWWGFLYAEYRPERIVAQPYDDAPKLTVGVRLTVPLEW